MPDSPPPGVPARSFRLLEARATSIQHPDTFAVPSPQELDAIRPGCWIKVGVKFTPGPGEHCDGERFWLAVQEVDGSAIAGTVCNDLVFTARHGLRDGDRLGVAKHHVMDIAF